MNIRHGTTIVLCGGDINYRELPAGIVASSAMVPVNGRPVIGWILNDLLDKQIDEATVVLQESDLPLQRFLDVFYRNRMRLTLAVLSQRGTILESLAAGLNASLHDDGHVRVILGDTLISDSFVSEEDFVYTAEVDDSRRWCLALTNHNGVVVDYVDKQIKEGHRLQAIAGYYHFTHRALLAECVSQSLAANARELSDVLRLYSAKQPIRALPTTNWFDFGHIDTLASARRRLLSTRCFNSLEIDPIRHTVTKTSRNNEKLADELHWYLNLPEELRVLTPRVISYVSTENDVRLTQEFYGYSNLAELFVFGDLAISAWVSILARVFEIHDLFRKYQGASSDLQGADLVHMYVSKTEDRLLALSEHDPVWCDLLSLETVVCNGKELLNLSQLMPRIREWGDRLAQTFQSCIVHGDFCFSNILFDLNSQIVRLIDPRGAFGRKGIYGDPRYDVAKLRHSVCGMYDFIVLDMFRIREVKCGFDYEVFCDGRAELAMTFDAMLADRGYDALEVRFIEGLLFASMIPLHQGKPQRQRMMYVRALELLNGVLAVGGSGRQEFNSENEVRHADSI